MFPNWYRGNPCSSFFRGIAKFVVHVTGMQLLHFAFLTTAFTAHPPFSCLSMKGDNPLVESASERSRFVISTFSDRIPPHYQLLTINSWKPWKSLLERELSLCYLLYSNAFVSGFVWSNWDAFKPKIEGYLPQILFNYHQGTRYIIHKPKTIIPKLHGNIE